ncbi:MAG: response regulator [Candidatus Omnitrophica bacterium]|nr:response regulator [Candidatus Omnitrophota bacterium]
MIKLLVVDDEIGVCDVIQKTFSYMGFSVSMATNARKALSIFKKERPKIIFLDLMMPDVSGMDLLRQFKTIDPSVIVIVVTAMKDVKAKTEAIACGADEYIHKPFSHNYLRDVVVEKIKGVLDKGGQMQRPKIFIVDDEVGLRQSMRAFIAPRFECDIWEAGNAQEVLAKLKTDQPDIILLDIKMPGVSGLDIIGDIKKLSPEARIVIVSAWNSGEVMSRAVEMGAEDYISKPVSLVVLGEKLRMALLSMGKLVLKKV